MTSYFMNTYNVVIDNDMIRNMMQTNMNETMDLLSFEQVFYLIFFGLVPSYFIYKISINYQTSKQAFISKVKYLFILLVIMLTSILIFFKHYSSFVREHKPLRYTTNPTYWLYSVGHYINTTLTAGPIIVKPLGRDAKVVKPEGAQNKLIILVVGEATRADHFSYNGYHRETTPKLKKEEMINFPNVHSCGTSTAVSVPCMFSIYDQESYSYKKGIRSENILDVLNHTGEISILWRDNNSNSKGVALRVPYEDFKTKNTNTICNNDECRDEGMLVGLDTYIEKNKNKDILIVLHQMGNHGPAYYKRYPKEFEKFTPVCKTNQLEECTKEEINNAYDNALLYTDHFLSKTIGLLKQYKNSHKTAMIYMSDHGESLGENGIYLHGLPYFMAPSAQTHIPALVWLNKTYNNELKAYDINTDNRFTQDNLFHTLMGLYSVESSVYNPALDILRSSK